MATSLCALEMGSLKDGPSDLALLASHVVFAITEHTDVAARPHLVGFGVIHHWKLSFFIGGAGGN